MSPQPYGWGGDSVCPKCKLKGYCNRLSAILNSPVTREIWWPFVKTTGVNKMDEYIILNNLINKFIQLSPWIQAMLVILIANVILVIVYFLTLRIKKGKKQEWRDKYYRGDE